jgi:hypothetical protein
MQSRRNSPVSQASRRASILIPDFLLQYDGIHACFQEGEDGGGLAFEATQRVENLH